MRLATTAAVLIVIVSIGFRLGGVATPGWASSDQGALASASNIPNSNALEAPPRAEAESPAVLDDQQRIVSAIDLPTFERQASEYERAIVGDGVVTREEYSGAFEAANTCIETAAARIGDITVRPPDRTGETPQFGGLYSSDKAKFDAIGEAELECVANYWDHVLAAWRLEESHARNQPRWDSVADCLTAKGYAVPSGATRLELALAVGSPGDPITDFYSCEAQVWDN